MSSYYDLTNLKARTDALYISDFGEDSDFIKDVISNVYKYLSEAYELSEQGCAVENVLYDTEKIISSIENLYVSDISSEIAITIDEDNKLNLFKMKKIMKNNKNCCV